MSRNLQTNTGPPAPSVSDVLVSDAATAASIHIKVNHLSSNAATAHMLSKSSYHILQYGDNTHATAAHTIIQHCTSKRLSGLQFVLLLTCVAASKAAL